MQNAILIPPFIKEVACTQDGGFLITLYNVKMKSVEKKTEGDGSFWSFCLINGRLAEFNFEIKKGKFYLTYGHCYVKRSEYKTKYEQKMIDKDIKKHRFTFRNGKYRRVGESTPLPAKHFRIPKKRGKALSLEELRKKLLG